MILGWPKRNGLGFSMPSYGKKPNELFGQPIFFFSAERECGLLVSRTKYFALVHSDLLLLLSFPPIVQDLQTGDQNVAPGLQKDFVWPACF